MNEQKRFLANLQRRIDRALGTDADRKRTSVIQRKEDEQIATAIMRGSVTYGTKIYE